MDHQNVNNVINFDPSNSPLFTYKVFQIKSTFIAIPPSI